LLADAADEPREEFGEECDEPRDDSWENAAYDLAYGDGEPDAKMARTVLTASGDYKKTYLKILRESSDHAEKRLAAASDKGAPERFFDEVSAVAAGAVTDLKKFLAALDFTSLVPAARFETLAATAAAGAPKQHTAKGRLPNNSSYKVIYGPFETILEIEAFKLEPPRVLYYRTSDDLSSFKQYSASWTSAKSDKWTIKLSSDHPAIIALPELNYVILAQSYKSLASR
jgi:hypothetical protein